MARASKMLRDPGLLASSSGSDADYALSEPVEVIDIFVSHNWSCSATASWWMSPGARTLRIWTDNTVRFGAET